MTNYPKADTHREWFADRYPGAPIRPNVGVLHTTEGTSLPTYSGGAVAPTYTAVPNFAKHRLDWYAHFPDERSARALVNAPGGVETNTLNAIQVELVGTCSPGIHAGWSQKGIPHIYWPEAPKWALDDLAEFVAWCHTAHGIQIHGPAPRWAAYPGSYGLHAAQRFTFAQWKNFYGWCGHQHVPENVHGDPGAFPWAYVERKAKSLVAPSPAPSPKKVHKSPAWDAIYENAVLAEKRLGTKKAPVRRKVLGRIKNLAARFSTRY